MNKGPWYPMENNKKSFSLPPEFKAYWNFQVISNVTCLKNIKTMHWSQTRINLIYMDFQTCSALSWDEALLSFSLVNRFPAGNANWKVSHLVQFWIQYLCTWITCGCEWNNDHVHAHDYCDISTDLKPNTRASAATNHVPVILQGCPKSVFYKISVWRSKNCLESSIAWVRLKISRCRSIQEQFFEAYLIYSLRFS